MDIYNRALQKHEEWQGKIEIVSRVPVKNKEDLSLSYTPGVAQPCLEIEKNKDMSYIYTRRFNTVAVITNGSAVLGLGDIGASASMPVMEGKCVLFKEFAGIDAYPISINSKDPKEIIKTVKLLEQNFGGINLEDIAAPSCFEIEKELINQCEIPVFHDDQHGTAIVCAAALINSLKITKKSFNEIKIVINGAGAAGISIVNFLLLFNPLDIVVCDKDGIINKNNINGLNSAQKEIANKTNRFEIKGNLADALKGADVFIGVSAPNLVTDEMVKSMSSKSIVFAMANPTPEIMPNEAIKAGAFIVGSGRSDFANQINNVLAFPGIFKGALAVRAKKISTGMKISAAKALADFIPYKKLKQDYILPAPFEEGIAEKIAQAVAKTAIEENLARLL